MRFLLFMFVTLASGTALGFETNRDDFRIDEQGRPLRISFPLHERVWCESGISSGDRPSVLTCAWDFRFALDFEDEAVFWRMRHRAARTAWDGGSALDVMLIEGNYHRHDKSSFIVIPGPDWKVPAKFDLVFQYRLGVARFDLASEQALPEEIEIIDAAVLADFWRDPGFRGHVGFGLAGRFDLPSVAPLEPEVLPFTAMRIYSEWQSRDGLVALRAQMTCGLVSQLVRANWTRTCRGDASLEWTPIAVNDLPVSLVFEAAGEESPRRQWSFGGNVRISLPTE